MRRSVVTGGLVFTAALCVVVGACLPVTAGAQVGTPWSRLYSGGASGAEKQALWDDIIRNSQRPGSPAKTILDGASEADRRALFRKLLRARMASRLLPLAFRLSLVGGTGYMAWTIYQRWQGGSPNQVFDLFLDHELLGSTELYNIAEGLPPEAYTKDAQWSWDRVEWELRTGTSHDTCPTAFGSSPCARLLLRAKMVPGISSWADEWPYENHPSPPPGRITWWSVPDHDLCILLSASCFGGAFPPSIRPPNYKRHALFAITQTQAEVADGEDVGGAPATRVQLHTATEAGPSGAAGDEGPTYGVFITDEQYTEIMGPVTETITEGNTGINSSPDVSQTFNVPGDQGTATDLENALEPFNDDCGRAFINASIQPGIFNYPSGCIEDTLPEPEPDADVITLPQPLVSETYAEYIVRLQEAGHVGTTTQTVLSEAAGDPEMGPEGIARLRITRANGTTITYRPTLWPEASPTIRIDAKVDAFTNPTTYISPTNPGLLPGSGGGSCDGYLKAAPNFGPLMSLRFADKFPFGLFSWFGSVIGGLVADPEAPVFTFDFGWIGVDEPYVVDLSVWDEYMATIRRLLAWAMWVGAVWFGAASLLGIRNTGDPGAAVDEVV